MQEKIDALNNLVKHVKDSAHPNVVKVVITITSFGLDVQTNTVDPEALKRDNKTMRNIRGEWIK
jgi:hypothetical protein